MQPNRMTDSDEPFYSQQVPQQPQSSLYFGNQDSGVHQYAMSQPTPSLGPMYFQEQQNHNAFATSQPLFQNQNVNANPQFASNLANPTFPQFAYQAPTFTPLSAQYGEPTPSNGNDNDDQDSEYGDENANGSENRDTSDEEEGDLEEEDVNDLINDPGVVDRDDYERFKAQLAHEEAMGAVGGGLPL